MATLTLPHKFQPRDYQLPLLKALDGGCKRAVITWHRRSGKDKVCFNYMVKRAFEKVGTYFYFLPSYTQAKKVVWDNIDNEGFKMLDHIPRELVVQKNKSELKIELKNGSVIQLIAADKFEESGVGTNPIGVVFSEYSINTPDVWNYVRPILKVNGGWAVFNFTPRGKNHAWNILQIARERSNWFSEILTVEDTGVLTKEDIEQEKQEGMTQDLIDQEYYCKFIDGASAFFKRVDENLWDAEPVEKINKFQLGVDLGKYQDYTVLTPFNINTFNVHEPERFNQIDWNLQKSKIENMYLRLGNPITYLDSTGLGDPIYDDLVERGMKNAVSFKFTNSSRMDLLNNLKLMIEQDKIKLPKNQGLIDELKSFQYVISPSGRISAEVPEGLHDDMVFSLALAVWQTPTNPQPLNVQSLRHLTKGGGEQIVTTSYE